MVFSVLPPLPGPLFSFLALVTAHHISGETNFSQVAFLVWGILGGLIILADYLLPAAATKKFGGTKQGIVGGMIGTLAGVIIPIPFGIIVGPLIGAIIGDLYGGKRLMAAMKSGIGSFAGFVLATLLKIAYSVFLGGVIIWKIGSFTLTSLMSYF